MELTEAKTLIAHDSLSHAAVPALWADLGCGSGLFTRALAELLPRDSVIYAVDRRRVTDIPTRYAGVGIDTLQKDFLRDPLDLPPLDGLLMANSLHFIPQQAALLSRLRRLLKNDGGFLLVEYNTATAVGRWNPFPVPFDALPGLFHPLGFSIIELLETMPSRFGRQNLYAAWIRR